MPVAHASRVSAAVLLFVAFFSVIPLATAQTRSMYMPALAPVSGTELSIALVNTESVSAEVTLTARTYDGAVIQADGITNPVQFTVSARNQLLVRSSETFGSAIANYTGWIEASTPVAGLMASSFVLVNDFPLDRAPLRTEPARQLIFPQISTAAGTSLNLVNVSETTVNANLVLFDNSGQAVMERPLTLSSRSGFNASISEIVPAGVAFEGYAVVEGSHSSLVGSEIYSSASDLAILRAVPGTNRLSSGYWPYFASLDGYSTKLTLINTTDFPQVVQITAVTSTGTRNPVLRTLLPHQRLEERASTLFNFEGDGFATGYISFATDDDAKAIVAALEYGNTDGLGLSTYEPKDSAYSDAYFSFVVANDTYYAGLSLLNPTAEPTDIFLDIFGQNGDTPSSAFLTLNPGEQRAGLLEDLFGQPISNTGYIHLSSSSPVMGLALFGTRDSGSLVNVTAQPTADQYVKPVTVSFAAAAPPPFVAGLSPASVMANSVQALNLQVSGTGFTNNSSIKYDGLKMRTTFVSSTLLLIALSTSQLSTGPHSVAVQAPGGGMSNAVAFTVTPNVTGTNQPPTANAGADLTITLPASATLNGTATDDGFPNGTLTANWTFVSGPGTVTFGSAASLSTTAAFSAAGSYVLRLTVNDSLLTNSDDVAVTVNPAISGGGGGGGGNYYVSTTGSDTNSGTSSSPWRTIQKAANTLKAGETVAVTAGTYSERVSVTNSGSSGSLITFQAQGTVSMRGFNIQGSYVKVDGFEIANVGGTDLFNRAANSGVHISGNYNTVVNTYIHDTNAEGIFLTTGANGSTLDSNRIVGAVDAGIYVQGTNHLIVSNDISHTVRTHPGMTNSGDADGIRFFGSGSTFRKNYIHDITLSDAGASGAHIDAFQTWGPCSNMIIEQNTIVQMESPDQGMTIEGMYQPTGNITIRNNIFMTKGTGYAPAVNAGDVGLVTNVNIVNNTMVALNGPSEYAIWLFPNLSGAVVKNNTIYDHGNSGEPYIKVEPGASGLSIGSNSISKSDGRAPIGSPYPGDLWLVNPQFVNFAGRDFHLQSTSPLINKGGLLSSVPNDFDGQARPLGSSHDIGAYEKQ